MSEQQAAEAAENTEQQSAVADQFAAADAQGDPGETPSVEEVASELGWMPQDKFRGPADKWKPAVDFIREGKNIQARQSQELKGIRETLDTIRVTNANIMQDKLAEQRAMLSRHYAQAVEQGDPDAAWHAANAINQIDASRAVASTPRRTPPAPETEQWVQRNQRLQRDPIAWRDALATCDAYARQYPNSSVGEQLQYTEQHMKARYPQLFDDKGPASVNSPTSRNTANGASRGKTAADLPKEAREIANDMADRGLIPNADAYAKNYFEALQRKA